VTNSGSSFTSDARSLVRTLPGRLFILSSAILFPIFIARQIVEIPDFVDTFRKVVAFAWVVSLVWLAVLAVSRRSGRFLWRVRQKLILSYVFLGFIPVLLVVSLTLVGGLVAYLNVAGYMFHEGFRDIADDVQQIAESTAAEIGRTPSEATQAIGRKYLTWSPQYSTISLAVIPVGAPKPQSKSVEDSKAAKANGPAKPTALPAATLAGPWRHTPAPDEVPDWLRGAPAGFRGVIGVPPAPGATEWLIVIRSAVPTRDGSRLVIVDLPVEGEVATAIEARTKERIGQVTVGKDCGGPETAQSSPALGNGAFTSFRQTVAFLDCRDWMTGQDGQVGVSVDAPLARLWAQVAATSPMRQAGASQFVLMFIVLGALFLIIQGAALFFGAVLARSITYAVHELFTGTERVQQGDFAHRIRVDSADQLGDLAGSFNRMSASIEHLLHVQREKQRLDDELRIAREIQKSLLPASPPVVPELSIADLCEPAREVGGDYYDFFDLGPRQIGVMIADVSGKGTSAALYMAELKGLMLSLSYRERSPRLLMIEANRLLSAHLDNRSFITMTYMVIDLDAGTMTCARAGHTPLLVVSGGKSEVIIPSGMVLGLRLPGAAERFSEVLEEHTRKIRPGDVFVLYTDGISEAMDPAGELFSDEGLATVVANHHELDAAGIRERVVREVRAFVGEGGEPHDDMTMIVVKILDVAEAAA
jgi:sigma-B regulation protein RsbU (phosphoserine phosphatase)